MKYLYDGDYEFTVWYLNEFGISPCEEEGDEIVQVEYMYSAWRASREQTLREVVG